MSKLDSERVKVSELVSQWWSHQIGYYTYQDLRSLTASTAVCSGRTWRGSKDSLACSERGSEKEN